MSLPFTHSKSNSLKNNNKPLNLRYGIIFFLLVFISVRVFSQSNGWKVQLEPQKAFIENKGQFQNVKSTDAVLFAYDGGNTRISFTKTGITYSFMKRLPKEVEINESDEKITSIEEWKEKEIEEHKVEYERDAVTMRWENTNPGVEIIASDVTPDYYSCSIKQNDGTKKNVNHIKSYKKLLYKNLYPGIDVEYVFNATSGIKYSLILHAGADISKVKMNYSTTPKLSGGEIHIPTKFGDIVDHAPLTFYADNKSAKIASSFLTDGKSVSFSLNKYNQNQSIIVDPWTDLPILPGSNSVWECERDAAGNVYIIGGETPIQLLKYSSTGALQWTYYTPYDTSNNGEWLGTFVTDLAGNSFVTNGSIAAISRINTTGGVDWSVNGGGSDEYWNIAFNCDQSKLVVGGTRIPNGMIFYIEPVNGSVQSFLKVDLGSLFSFPPKLPEVRSITASHNSRYYYLCLDTLGFIDDNYNSCANSPSIFKLNHGLNFAYKCENFRPNNGNSGIMAIRANKNFVYTQNGSVIQQRSLIDGSIINSVTIPGGSTLTSSFGSQAGNAGIDIDSCGYVYVGSSDGVYEFDPGLNLITSFATTYKVYDVAVSTNGDVVFCGATNDCNYNGNRSGTIQSTNFFTACPPSLMECCNANICPVAPMCNNASPITLSAGSTGGTWSGPGVDPGTGVFDPSVAGAGTITITYTMACGSSSINITVNPCGCPTVTPTTSNVVDVCTGQTNGSFTVNTSGGADPYNYTLLNGATPIATYNSVSGPQDFTGLAAGTYTLNVIDANGCPGNIMVTISSLTNLNPAITGPTSVCPGNPGTLDAGAGYSSYTWSTGGSNQTISVTTAGTYSVTVANGSGCTGSASINITATVITATLNPQNETCLHKCDGSIDTLNITGASKPYSYLWSNGKTTAKITGLCPGNYSLTITDANSCTKVVNATIGTDVNINANFTANPQSGSIPLIVTFNYTGTGATSWYWDFGDGSHSTNANPVHTYDSLGNYTVVLIVSSGNPDNCADTSKLVIEVQKPSSLIVPNIFTPNSDGFNDEFKVQFKEIETFSCSIYNRWGKKIFEWSDITKGWDGKTNGGKLVADGVYYYIIVAKGYDKVDYDLHGTVTLLK